MKKSISNDEQIKNLKIFLLIKKKALFTLINPTQRFINKPPPLSTITAG